MQVTRIQLSLEESARKRKQRNITNAKEKELLRRIFHVPGSLVCFRESSLQSFTTNTDEQREEEEKENNKIVRKRTEGVNV